MSGRKSGVRVKVGPERIVLTDGLQPFLFRSSRGTMIVQAQFSPPHGFIRAKKNVVPGHGAYGFAISRDDGRTWDRWNPETWKKREPYFEGAFVELADGTIQLYEWVAQPTSRSGRFTITRWESSDDLQTLRGPIRSTINLPQAKNVGFDDNGLPYTGLTFHRTVLETPAGDLLAAVYCWFKGDDVPCSYQPKMCKFRCVLLRSTNRGRHWDFVSTIAADGTVGEEGFNEPVLVRLSQGPRSGRLICIMRTGSNDCALHQAVSDDDGATWTKAKPMTLHGVDPDLIELTDGTLACSFGRRMPDWVSRKPPAKFGNYVAFSHDQGRTWKDLTYIPIEAQSNTPWTTCYTTIRQTGPRALYLVYDIGRWGMPVRYIGGRRLEY